MFTHKHQRKCSLLHKKVERVTLHIKSTLSWHLRIKHGINTLFDDASCNAEFHALKTVFVYAKSVSVFQAVVRFLQCQQTIQLNEKPNIYRLELKCQARILNCCFLLNSLDLLERRRYSKIIYNENQLIK